LFVTLGFEDGGGGGVAQNLKIGQFLYRRFTADFFITNSINLYATRRQRNQQFRHHFIIYFVRDLLRLAVFYLLGGVKIYSQISGDGLGVDSWRVRWERLAGGFEWFLENSGSLLIFWLLCLHFLETHVFMLLILIFNR
jgi:hypothetical protein